MTRAILLLALGVMRHYAYGVFPGALHAQVWNILGAVVMLALLWCLVAGQSWPVIAVAGWWTFEEAQVVICSTAYIIRPWEVPEGVDQCSALVGLDIGAIGIAVVAALLFKLSSTLPYVAVSEPHHGPDND